MTRRSVVLAITLVPLGLLGSAFRRRGRAQVARGSRTAAPFQDVANATVQIHSGENLGSGFHFLRPEIIVTNRHVLTAGAQAVAVTEVGRKIPLTLLAESPVDQYDYAILRAQGTVPPARAVLRPKLVTPVPRGLAVVFGGFPHGVEHLLVQSGYTAGR